MQTAQPAIRRPTSVTIIGCIEIAIGLSPLVGFVVSLVRTGSLANQAAPDSPIPVPLQYGLSFASMVVGLASGYFILNGKNWARWLLVLWSLFCILFVLISSPMQWMLLPGAAYLAAIAYSLFRPEANRFFAAVATGTYMPDPLSLRGIISGGLYVVSGFTFATSCMLAFFEYPEQAAIAELFVLVIFLFPGAIFLALGRVVSENPEWKREIGVVLIVSAAAGAWLWLSLALMFNDPAFQQRAGQDNSTVYSDYTMGGLWIASMFLLGALLLHVARREADTPPIHAPVASRKKR